MNASQPAPEPQPCAQEAPAPESASAILSSKIAGGICFNSCETYKSAEIGCAARTARAAFWTSPSRFAACANCRIAVFVALYEVDSCGCETPCGMKMFAVGPPPAAAARISPVSGLRFIRFRRISPARGASCCRRRCINVKIMTNYIDFGESSCHF